MPQSPDKERLARGQRPLGARASCPLRLAARRKDSSSGDWGMDGAGANWLAGMIQGLARTRQFV